MFGPLAELFWPPLPLVLGGFCLSLRSTCVRECTDLRLAVCALLSDEFFAWSASVIFVLVWLEPLFQAARCRFALSLVWSVVWAAALASVVFVVSDCSEGVGFLASLTLCLLFVVP